MLPQSVKSPVDQNINYSSTSNRQNTRALYTHEYTTLHHTCTSPDYYIITRYNNNYGTIDTYKAYITKEHTSSYIYYLLFAQVLFKPTLVTVVQGIHTHACMHARTHTPYQLSQLSIPGAWILSLGPGTNCLKIHLNFFSFFPTFFPYFSDRST